MQRPLLPGLISSLVLVACTQTSSGPATVRALPLSDMQATSGADVAAARNAVVRFLDAYANAGSNQARAFQNAVGSPQLGVLANWLAIQDQAVPGTRTGTVALNSVRFVELQQMPGATVARLEVTASVALTYRPPTGPAESRTIDFSGEAIAIELSTGDWAVADITENGQSLARQIHPESKQLQRRGGVTIGIHSVLTGLPYWSFNVIVLNKSSSPVRLDLGSLSIVGSSGSITPHSVSPGLAVIPAKKDAAGTISFAPPRDSSGRLVIGFTSSGRGTQFDFPLKALLKSPLGLPGPGASPSPAPGPSSAA